MTPLIALDLSLDGIVVMSRAPAGPDHGTWWREGIVRLDDEDLAGTMQRMRAICAARVGEDFTSILVIPDSQLLFTSFERDDRDARATIRMLLEGRTPYPVEALTFDFVTQGGRLQVAVVARDTLEEAEAFAAGFGFRPVALVGNPAASSYPGLPKFGQTRIAAELLHRAALTLDLGEGFDVVPAPSAPARSAADDGGASAAPQEIGVTEPTIDPAPTPPHVPPAVLPEDPSDFASVMDATPDAPPPAEGGSLDVAEVALDASEDEDSSAGPAPAFATRRRAPATEAARTEPGLSRISPRLSPPAPANGEPRAMLRGPARARDEVPEAKSDGSSPLGAASSRLAALSALVGRKGRAATGRDRTKDGARERAATRRGSRSTPDDLRTPPETPPPLTEEPRGSGRLGLYLTLSLLALLGLLALWSLTLDDDDIATRAAGEDTSSAADVVAPAEPLAEPSVETAEVAVADLGPGDGAGEPVAVEPAEEDLALLLPDSRGAVPVEADAAELSDEEETTADVGPGITVVTTDAEPFELPRSIAAAPGAGSAEDIYVASIDPVISGNDAVALPRAVPATDAFAPQTSPAPAGTAFATGTDGLVVASAAGTLAPGGYSVVAGRPAVLPAPRPVDRQAEDSTADAADEVARVLLGRNRPVPRPEDAPERAERLSFNGLTREELTRTPPVRRPAAIEAAVARAEAAATRQAAAVQAAASAAVASLAQSDAPAGAPVPEAGTDLAFVPSEYALGESRRPRERPRAVEQDAARIVTQRRAQPAPAAVASAAATQPAPAQVEASQPVLRSAGGSVSRAATQSNQIRLREMNLIGVYGRPNARRALVRLSNGRYVKVEVGDRLERGRVTAIGESEVIYQQNGRNYALRMPQT